MISSEVQRTLVKSPPELWAELSDPGALARHLGEFGEIRITRVEPEQLVEWEAENRTGTVHIKPSGWGTRVTLTVSTDVPEVAVATPPGDDPQADEAAAEATAHAAHAPAAPAPEDSRSPVPDEESAGMAEDEQAAVAEDEPAIVAEDEPAIVAEDEPAPVEDGSAVRDESVPSPLGVPLTAAAASSWRAGIEREYAEDPSRGWIGKDDRELQAGTDGNEEPGETYEWRPYKEPEPRRGFFARLLGRWRRPEDPDADSDQESLEVSSEADSPREPEPEAPAGEVMAKSSEPPLAELEPVHEDPVEPIAELSAEEPEAPVEPIAAVLAEEPETPVEPITELSAGEADAASPDQAEQGKNIAAELEAAEETAEAEVTAVLTSVLDRLGAAHHRPFSRS